MIHGRGSSQPGSPYYHIGTSSTLSGPHSGGTSSAFSSPYRPHQSLFGYSRKRPATRQSRPAQRVKRVPWMHTFVCLASKDACSVPTDYSLLTANSLGKAKIHLFESSTAMEIHDAIMNTFSKLVDAGGYDFMRTTDNSKQLRVIVPPTDGYTGM